MFFLSPDFLKSQLPSCPRILQLPRTGHPWYCSLGSLDIFFPGFAFCIMRSAKTLFALFSSYSPLVPDSTQSILSLTFIGKS